jgi:hypothetical protein
MNDHANWRFCTVERITHTLVLMDADGEVLELHEIAPTKGGHRGAKRTVMEWARHYTFEYAAAMNLI